MENWAESLLEIELGKLVLGSIVVLLFITPAMAGVNSVENITFSSNNSFFSGPVFVLEFTANDQTDGINAIVENDKLESASSSGEINQNIRIRAMHTETRAEYSFRKANLRPISRVDSINFFVNTYATQNRQQIVRHLNNSSLVEEKCLDINGDGDITESSDFAFNPNVFRDWNFETEIYCYSGSKIASTGEIASNPSAIFLTNFSISNGERTVTKTISNGRGGSGSSTRIQDDAHIQWKGSIGTGRNAANPTDEMIAHSNSEGWRIINRGQYNNYLEELRKSHSLLEKWKEGYSSATRIENTINSAANQAYSPHSDTEFRDAKFNGSNFENGEMSLEIDNLRYPEFNIFLNACKTKNCNALIQIEKTAGKPAITNFSGTRLTELSNGRIHASIKNIGSSEGSFSSRVTNCSDGFAYSGTLQTFNLEAGKSKDIALPVSFSSQNNDRKISGHCTIQFKEQTTGFSVTREVSLTGIQQKECTPNRQSVKTIEGRDYIQECQQNALSLRTIEVCKTNEHAEANDLGYECVSDDKLSTYNKCEIKILGQSILNPSCIAKETWKPIENTSEILSSANKVSILTIGAAGYFLTLVGYKTLNFTAAIFKERI